jgi:hypothetical protein
MALEATPPVDCNPGTLLQHPYALPSVAESATDGSETWCFGAGADPDWYEIEALELRTVAVDNCGLKSGN